MRHLPWELWAVLLVSATLTAPGCAQGADRAGGPSEAHATNPAPPLVCFGIVLAAGLLVVLYALTSHRDCYRNDYSYSPSPKFDPGPATPSRPNAPSSRKSEVRSRKPTSQAEKNLENKTQQNPKLAVNAGFSRVGGTACPGQVYDMAGARLALTLCVTAKRKGAARDIAALNTMFEALGFEHQVIRNPTASDFKGELRKFQKAIDNRGIPVSCCFVFIMAHSEASRRTSDSMVVFGADEHKMELEELFAEMTNETCRALQGKPKVFVIQACRGDRRDKGALGKESGTTYCATDNSLSARARSASPPSSEPDVMKLIPTHSDSLFVYAAAPGHVAYRSEQDGSCLIENIEKVFKECEGFHMLELLTEVIHRVSDIDFQEEENTSQKYKMSPVFQSSLRKLLYLRGPNCGRSLPPRPSSRVCCPVVTDDSGIMVQRPSVRSISLSPEKEMTRLMEKLKLESQTGLRSSPEQYMDVYDMAGARLALTLCVTAEREGAERDIAAVKGMFEALGFEHQVIRNPMASDFKRELRKFQKDIDARSSPVSCSFVFIMAHGNRGFVKASDGQHVKLDKLFARMTNETCRALRGKPKVFIIQSCRGGNKDSGVPLEDHLAVDSAPGLPNAECYKLIPTHTDSLFVYASAPGHVAYRDEQNGCRLIQTIAEVFKESQGAHVLELLTEVIGKVAENHFSVTENGKTDTRMMSPVLQSSLRKLLYLQGAGQSSDRQGIERKSQ